MKGDCDAAPATVDCTRPSACEAREAAVWPARATASGRVERLGRRGDTDDRSGRLKGGDMCADGEEGEEEEDDEVEEEEGGYGEKSTGVD